MRKRGGAKRGAHSSDARIVEIVFFALRTGFGFVIAVPRAEVCANIATGWVAVR